MNFYQDLGFLIMGTRMKRLSDTFLQDVNRFYQSKDIEFDASWFPIFYLLGRKKELSIREIANTLQVTHSAVSQLVTSLQQKGYLTVKASKTDRRAKVVTLSARGTQRLLQVQPIWLTLQHAMQQMAEETPVLQQFLSSLSEIENALADQSLFSRMEEQYSKFESK